MVAVGLENDQEDGLRTPASLPGAAKRRLQARSPRALDGLAPTPNEDATARSLRRAIPWMQVWCACLALPAKQGRERRLVCAVSGEVVPWAELPLKGAALLATSKAKTASAGRTWFPRFCGFAAGAGERRVPLRSSADERFGDSLVA